MMTPLCRAVLTVLALALLAPAARPDGAESRVRPTVTAADGDTGGKLFGRIPEAARTHHYYIAAENTSWDFTPSGRDEVCGLMLPPSVVSNRSSDKVRYIQYSDATFTARVFSPPSLGILGPVLRGVVGDHLAVTFLNRTAQPLSMHPHGVRYDKDNEGSYYQPAPGRGAAVAPGARFTYVWQLDENSGPMPGEPSSKAWLYHSHVEGDVETNLGLMGCIIVTDPKRARPDGTPADVDREFATMFMIFDESMVDEDTKEAIEHAVPGAPPPPISWTQLQQMTEEGARAAINGRIFGNLRGLEMNEGEHTRWYLFGLGSEKDFHTAHWHGLRVIEEGRRRTDVVDLLPATMKVADLLADNPGDWLFHCHVAEHMREGMFARITIHPRQAVGVSRAADAAFLGLPKAAQSMRIGRAELVGKGSGPAGAAELVIEGDATTFDGFAIFSQPVRVQLGQKTAVFKLAEGNAGRESGAVFRVTNANEFGVVRGGSIHFQLVASGADWLEPAPAGSASRSNAAAPVPLSVDFGAVHHMAVAAVTTQGK